MGVGALNDSEAYRIHKKYRKWFNKLYLSESLGYNCGPCGIAPSVSGEYVVRPIYNLSGMGVGAKVINIESGDNTKTPPGYFWCEYFEGEQYSVTYEFVHCKNPYWKPISSYKGEKLKSDLSRFYRWNKTDHYPTVPRIFNELSGVRIINIEYIEDKPIEVHLRESPDPKYETIIPVWEDNKDIYFFSKLGYTYIESYDNADGFLGTARLGFMVK